MSVLHVLFTFHEHDSFSESTTSHVLATVKDNTALLETDLHQYLSRCRKHQNGLEPRHVLHEAVLELFALSI
jgi:hypothetical protein